MNNEFKQQLQEREFAILKDKQRVILKWATGCGKSKMAIDLINHATKDRLQKSGLHHICERVLFVVAERAHIQNWEDEFNKWKLDRANISTDICCYASLKKYKDFSYDIVVLDEGHHVFSEKRMAALEDLKDNLMPWARIYLLSATLSSGKEDLITGVLGKFYTSTVTLKDAIRNDILPDPRIYVIGMELDNSKTDQELRVNKADDGSPVVEWEKRSKYLYKNLPCIIKCTEKQKYIYYTDTMEYWKRRYELSHNQFQHNLWVNTGSVRKRYLGELKTSVVYKLIQKIKNKRYVCFCASVNQAEMLSSHNTISSKKSSKYNQHIIDSFNEKKISNIYAVGMITEGMNLNGIEIGVIAQLDGKERLFVQKAGRVLRADDPIAFICYYKDTQDEVYLKNALDNIDEKYVQHININQLNAIKL